MKEFSLKILTNIRNFDILACVVFLIQSFILCFSFIFALVLLLSWVKLMVNEVLMMIGEVIPTL